MAGGAMISGAGDPWWTQNLGGGYGNLNTLTKSAPPGYTYDPTQLKYVPIVGSAGNQLDLQKRNQTFQDQDRQTQKQFDERRLGLEDQLSGAISGLTGRMSSFGSEGASPSGSAPQISVPGVSPSAAPGSVSAPAPVSYGGNDGNLSMAVDNAANAAQTAAFGKAKANAGSLGASAVNTMRSNLAERGLVGGGTEARSLSDRIAAATNPLSDLNVAQLGENETNARHNQDIGAHAAEVAYNGGIAERGQNIGVQNANADRSLTAANASADRNLSASNANAERQLQFQTTSASLAQQKQLALQAMMQSALTGLTGAAGRLY